MYKSGEKKETVDKKKIMFKCKQIESYTPIGGIKWAFTGRRRGVKTKFQDKSEAKLPMPGTVLFSAEIDEILQSLLKILFFI